MRALFFGLSLVLNVDERVFAKCLSGCSKILDPQAPFTSSGSRLNFPRECAGSTPNLSICAGYHRIGSVGSFAIFHVKFLTLGRYYGDPDQG